MPIFAQTQQDQIEPWRITAITDPESLGERGCVLCSGGGGRSELRWYRKRMPGRHRNRRQQCPLHHGEVAGWIIQSNEPLVPKEQIRVSPIDPVRRVGCASTLYVFFGVEPPANASMARPRARMAFCVAWVMRSAACTARSSLSLKIVTAGDIVFPFRACHSGTACFSIIGLGLNRRS